MYIEGFANIISRWLNQDKRAQQYRVRIEIGGARTPELFVYEPSQQRINYKLGLTAPT